MGNYRLWDEEVEVFHAVAEAQKRTGLFVPTQACAGRPGLVQLRTLIEAGCDPERMVIGNCDACTHEELEQDLDYYDRLLGEGAWVEFDLFGWEELCPDKRRFERVAALVHEGFTDRILLSLDICRRSQLDRYGGRGYNYLFRVAGGSEEEIRQMTVRNPACILTRPPNL